MGENDGNQTMNKRSSGVEIPPRSMKQETLQHQAEIFTYLGCHFIPVGFSTDSGSPAGQRRIRMMEWAAEPFYGVSGSLYSKKSFLEFAESEADVYYCVEKDLYYMPGERKLFEYRGEFRWLPGKGAEADELKREKGLANAKDGIRQRQEEPPKVLSRKRQS